MTPNKTPGIFTKAGKVLDSALDVAADAATDIKDTAREVIVDALAVDTTILISCQNSGETTEFDTMDEANAFLEEQYDVNIEFIK